MHHAAQAYGAVAKQIASPRDLEASLLLKAASRLQAVHDGWDTQRTVLDEALRFNRRLWTLFLNTVTNSDNPLPVEIRQNIANLGIFVINQTMSITVKPERERLPSLISINCEVAAGLRAGR